jgi:hypothetical protein
MWELFLPHTVFQNILTGSRANPALYMIDTGELLPTAQSGLVMKLTSKFHSVCTHQYVIMTKQKQTPWPESASELYDRATAACRRSQCQLWLAV